METGNIYGATARTKSRNGVEFNPPLTGKNGNLLTGYEWSWKQSEKFSKHDGGLVATRVSDWDKASKDNKRLHHKHLRVQKRRRLQQLLEKMTEKQLTILKYLPEIMTDFPDLFPTASGLLDSYEKDGSLKLSDTWVRYVLSNYIGLKEVYSNNSILQQVLDYADPISHELIAHLHYTQVMATLNVYLFSSPGCDLEQRMDVLKAHVAHLCGHILQK